MASGVLTEDRIRDDFRIVVEPARMISPVQELTVLRAAHARQPGSAMLRARLAMALLIQDAFDEAIMLLAGPGAEAAGPLGSGEIKVLLQAHLGRETGDDDARVVEIVDRLLPSMEDASVRAQLLADQAKALRRLDRIAEARTVLEKALVLNPANKDACKRLAAIDLDTGAADGMIATLDRLAADGASHARLHAARALAHARAGRIAQSRDVVALDDFHHAGLLETPPGMASLAAFNAALAAELLDHPGLRYERYGTASEQTWRIDTPALGAAPMVRLLLDGIAQVAERHVAGLAGSDHPWVRARPDGGMLHCWCVMTDGTGYETWHVHQFGWLSGVYYVQIPPSVTAGDDDAGCIAFGLPGDMVGEGASAAFGSRVVRPEEGMLMLFPSHTYHRTFPHGAAERRICVAFDIWPT